MSKPISIIEVPGGYGVYVNSVPVVQSGKGIDFDRNAAGLKTKKGYKPPTSTLPAVFGTAGDAAHVAHKIGRYVLSLGDFVQSYTKLVSQLPAQFHDEWWEKALKE